MQATQLWKQFELSRGDLMQRRQGAKDRTTKGTKDTKRRLYYESGPMINSFFLRDLRVLCGSKLFSP
jgi:hypothetical protein